MKAPRFVLAASGFALQMLREALSWDVGERTSWSHCSPRAGLALICVFSIISKSDSLCKQPVILSGETQVGFFLALMRALNRAELRCQPRAQTLGRSHGAAPQRSLLRGTWWISAAHHRLCSPPGWHPGVAEDQEDQPPISGPLILPDGPVPVPGANTPAASSWQVHTEEGGRCPRNQGVVGVEKFKTAVLAGMGGSMQGGWRGRSPRCGPAYLRGRDGDWGWSRGKEGEGSSR